jgi:hypothetical protein
MNCGFCDGALTERVSVPGREGETGGLWEQQAYDCAGCGASVVHDMVMKIGAVREEWKFGRAPTTTTRRTKLHCPACDVALISAWPPGFPPYAVTGFSPEQRCESVRTTEHACVACGERYHLVEVVDTTWYGGDGTQLATPRPYPARR